MERLRAYKARLDQVQGDLLGNALDGAMRLPLSVDVDQISVSGFGHLKELPARVTAGTALLWALERCEQPWQLCARRFGSELVCTQAQVRRKLSWGGEQGEPSVRVQLVQRQAQLHTHIHVSLALGFPFSITHKSQDRGPSVSVGNPIFDSLLHIQTQAPHELSALLQDSRLVERVMAICHGLPGSTLTHQVLLIHIDGDPGPELIAQVQAALELAQLLSQAGAAANGTRATASQARR